MNTEKILIIGQAPPVQKQTLPYDTTMLYNWFHLIGVSKEQAVELFEFDAVYDKFPGFDANKGHLKPTTAQMEEYWERALKKKVDKAPSILVLGSHARDFLKTKNIQGKYIVYTIHPSTRNYGLYANDSVNILNSLKSLLPSSSHEEEEESFFNFEDSVEDS